MSKYNTGEYVLTLFDTRGTKIDQFPVEGGSLMKAQTKGYELIECGKCASFNVARNVFNSLDPKGPW
jgi:hypothetical protein